eukprot:GHVN01057491.1.p2 GENE.GHVN01057491.1~~GHVN01057491.1.p2  ORF type:complete len:103 (-),score=5.34 GHVN01057491.1:79-363(-)
MGSKLLRPARIVEKNSKAATTATGQRRSLRLSGKSPQKDIVLLEEPSWAEDLSLETAEETAETAAVTEPGQDVTAIETGPVMQGHTFRGVRQLM